MLRIAGFRLATPVLRQPSAVIATRGFRTTPVSRLEGEAVDQIKAKAATKQYLQPELFPLYGIVVLAVGAALYSLGGHLFMDNDLRRLPEHPTDKEGNPSHEPQHAPDFKPIKRKEIERTDTKA